MGEGTEGRVCAGGCGKTLRHNNKTGYCAACWNVSPLGNVYRQEWRATNRYASRELVKCACGKRLNASRAKSGMCHMCWRKTAEGREFYASNHNRWDRERMATPEAKMLLMVRFANERARKSDIPYGVALTDLMPLPTTCPVLGLSLDYSRGPRAHNSASLDRIVPSLGYVAGNVRIISWRANCLKRDGTPDELYAVAMDAMRVAKRIV